MRVFLNDLKVLSVIDKKEEITEHTFLVTDEECSKIEETLANNGVFWIIDKYTIGCSGKRPSEIYNWNDELKEWVVDEELKAKKKAYDLEKLWAKLKDIMISQAETGVFVCGYWWHTDTISRMKYNELSRLILIGEEINEEWSTMSGEIVILDNDLFKQLNKDIYAKTKHDYNNAKRLLAMAEKLDNPLEQEITDGWSATYKEFVKG